MIYLVVCFKSDVCKIGYSVSPQQRLSQLQNASPDKLELVSVKDGDLSKEKELHLRFSKDRIRGEWFRYSSEIKEYFGENYQIRMYDEFMDLLMISEKSELHLFSYFLRYADGTVLKLYKPNREIISKEVGLNERTIYNILPQMVKKGYILHMGKTAYCVNPFVAFRGTEKERKQCIAWLIECLVLSPCVLDRSVRKTNNPDIYFK